MSEKQPTAEEQKTDIFRKLAAQAPELKAINAKVNRANGLDGNLNRSKESTINYIDRLLDKYNVLHLSGIPTLAEEPDNQAQCIGAPYYGD